MVHKPNPVNYVGYYCGSQNHAGVANFVAYNKGKLLGEYVEGVKRWPKLAEAVEFCRKHAATLVIGKIGRLARNRHFLAHLQGIEVAALDNKYVNQFNLPTLIGTAEEESEKVSERTRRTLREAVKTKGIKLGSARPGHWNAENEHLRGTRKAIAASARMREVRTRETYAFLIPTLKKMRLAGKTMGEIAEWLNDHDHKTTAGHPFGETSVWRLLKRYLGDDFLGHAKDRGGTPKIIRAMETVK